VKLNLGCWDRIIPGFINIESQDIPGVDIVADVKNLKMFEDSTVELIYASHVIAYFDQFEIIDVFAEWKRVLRPGGTLRVSTPNLLSLISIYEMSLSVDKIKGPLYGRMFGSQGLIFHRQIFDQDALTKLFVECGFENVEDWDWRKTEHAKIDDHSQAYYPHMEKDSGLQVSLNMQAKKPNEN
jgi:predicted SAM-dependent methyltransferase